MASRSNITLNDFDGQAGSLGFAVAEITPANFANHLTQMGVILTTLDPITDGLPVAYEMTRQVSQNASFQKSTVASSQRGNKWAVTYRDSQEMITQGAESIPNVGFNKIFAVEIPTATFDLRENNSDIVYNLSGISVAGFGAFVTAFNGFARSPYGGSVQILEIRAVTRTGG